MFILSFARIWSKHKLENNKQINAGLSKIFHLVFISKSYAYPLRGLLTITSSETLVVDTDTDNSDRCPIGAGYKIKFSDWASKQNK